MKKEIDYNTTKDIRSLFWLKKENKTIKERIIRDNRNIFELEEDYYKPEKVGNFWCNSSIDYRNKGNSKTLSVEEYLNEIKSYLKDTMTDLKRSDFS